MKFIRRMQEFRNMWSLPVNRQLRQEGRNSLWESLTVCWKAACAYCRSRERWAPSQRVIHSGFMTQNEVRSIEDFDRTL